MSDERALSRRQGRGKGREIIGGDTTKGEALVERLKQSGKGRRGARVAFASSIELTRKARLKRVRPASQ